jgi:hypothetical protein
MKQEKNASAFFDIKAVPVREDEAGECSGFSDPKQEKTLRSSIERISVFRNNRCSCQ